MNNKYPEQIKEIFSRELNVEITNITQAEKGSSNFVYIIHSHTENFVAKIAYRADRIEAEILKKEVEILRKLSDIEFAIPIPKVSWFGNLNSGEPVCVESYLPGTSIDKFLSTNIDCRNAGVMLGAWMGQLHNKTHEVIDEFEPQREPMPDFVSYAKYWLEKWKPLCTQAKHLPAGWVDDAYQYIFDNLYLFDDATWSCVHADLSSENILGVLEGGELKLTGICDFENVQTGPAEYDFATLFDSVLMARPDMLEHVLVGYDGIRERHVHFEQRLNTAGFFRSMRYIKRNVKYTETQFFGHDKDFLEIWRRRTGMS